MALPVQPPVVAVVTGRAAKFLKNVDTVPQSSIPVSSVHLEQLVEDIPVHNEGEVAPFVLLR